MASSFILSVIPFFYYSSNKAGTIPIVSILLTNYKNPYYITCASVNKKRTGPSHNKVNKFLKSSLNYFYLYPLVNVIVKSLYFVEKPANLVKLCFPDPP